MKTCRTFLALLLLTALGLRAELEFSGFFLTSTDAHFSLTETEGNRSSGWLKIGEAFGGYTLVAFDREREILTLQQAGRTRELPLRTAKVKDGKATIRGTIAFRGEQVEGVRASLFLGEEAVFPLKNGVTFRIKPESRPDGTLLYRAKFVTLQPDGTEKVLSAPAVVALPGKAFAIQLGDLGFSFTP
jgi:hypothetical protein